MTVTAAPGGASRVIITVADQGVGMDAEALGRAFEPYFSTKTGGIRPGSGEREAEHRAQRRDDRDCERAGRRDYGDGGAAGGAAGRRVRIRVSPHSTSAEIR